MVACVGVLIYRVIRKETCIQCHNTEHKNLVWKWINLLINIKSETILIWSWWYERMTDAVFDSYVLHVLERSGICIAAANF